MFESSRFVNKDWWSSRNTEVAFPILYQSPAAFSHLLIPSHDTWTSPRDTVQAIATHRTHCLWFLEKYDTLVFSVLIFIPVWSHAPENQSRACWRICWGDASSTKSSKSKQLVMQLPTVTPSSTQLLLFIQLISTSGFQPGESRSPSIGYEKQWWQQTPMSESNHNDGRLWFNPPDTATNIWARMQWLDSQ